MELKPCPFCGGEAEESEPTNGSPFWKIHCKRCWATMGGSHRRMNRDDWNARAERTCRRVVQVPAERGGGQPALRAVCSECGDKLGVTAAFCKRCGAKVVW